MTPENRMEIVENLRRSKFDMISRLFLPSVCRCSYLWLIFEYLWRIRSSDRLNDFLSVVSVTRLVSIARKL